MWSGNVNAVIVAQKRGRRNAGARTCHVRIWEDIQISAHALTWGQEFVLGR